MWSLVIGVWCRVFENKQTQGLCEESTPHLKCDGVGVKDSGFVIACSTPARRDTADLMAWGSGVFLYAVVTSCMRLLMRGRLYDSQNMTHSSLWIQLSGFQQGHRLLSRASHHRAHSSAKLWHKHASELQWGSNHHSTYSIEEMSV